MESQAERTAWGPSYLRKREASNRQREKREEQRRKAGHELDRRSIGLPATGGNGVALK
jgi:hypothetical protein